MALKSTCLLLLLFLPFVVALESRRVVPWKPILNVKDYAVVESGRFAVREHNKKEDTYLKFERVLEGKRQLVDGIKFELVISAKDGAASNKYQALVHYNPWLRTRELNNFKKIV